MAQGDLTVLNYAAKLVLDGAYYPSSYFQIAAMLPTVTAKYNDDENDIGGYRIVSSSVKSVNIGEAAGRFYIYSPVLYDRNAELSQVYQFLIYKTFPNLKPLAFIDATEDGGVTPHDLSVTPLKLNFSYSSFPIFYVGAA